MQYIPYIVVFATGGLVVAFFDRRTIKVEFPRRAPRVATEPGLKEALVSEVGDSDYLDSMVADGMDFEEMPGKIKAPKKQGARNESN